MQKFCFVTFPVPVLPKKLEDTVMNTNILYICDKCKKSFRREAALKRHVEYDHRERDSSDEDAPQQYVFSKDY